MGVAPAATARSSAAATLGAQCDLEARRGGAGRLRVLAQLPHQAVGRKRQRCAAGLQFAVVPAFMQKTRGQAKGRLVKLERGGYVGDVKDGVAELHGSQKIQIYKLQKQIPS